jgi:hypothetical protein
MRPVGVLFGVIPATFVVRTAIFAALFAPAIPAQAARVLIAGERWAAIDFGARCEARSSGMWPKSGTRPFAGFAFDRLGRRNGQFYVHLSRPARAGATIIATIGSEPFLLVGRGEWAWSRSAGQQQSMIHAIRYGDWMRIDARDEGGSRIVDRYAVRGAATAIDAAAARCAGKSR